MEFIPLLYSAIVSLRDRDIFLERAGYTTSPPVQGAETELGGSARKTV